MMKKKIRVGIRHGLIKGKKGGGGGHMEAEVESNYSLLPISEQCSPKC